MGQVHNLVNVKFKWKRGNVKNVGSRVLGLVGNDLDSEYIFQVLRSRDISSSFKIMDQTAYIV
jgi:hypothetical protein